MANGGLNGDHTGNYACNRIGFAYVYMADTACDVQLAERAHLRSGTNYMLNFGEGNVPSNVQTQMNHIWLGEPTNIRENPFFRYSRTRMYQYVKTQPQPLTSISVLEQAEQGRNTVGVLVSAKSLYLDNAAYLAFANGQVITGADKFGELFYTVFPVKGVSVPWANLST